MLRIQINDPTVVADLREALADADCSAVPVGDDMLLVTHPFAADEAEEKLELAFFLRAWQERRPEVEVQLLR